MFCPNCGKEVKEGDAFCPNCGAKIDNSVNNDVSSTTVMTTTSNDMNTRWLVALILCVVVGGLGIHRFFVGKIGTGILWLLTFGCFGIGVIVDLIMIVCQQFTDSDGKPLTYRS